MPFENYLETRYLREIKKRKLLEDLIYITPNNNERIVVKKNYLTDGASIPRIFRSVIGGKWNDDYFECAIVHDHQCDLAHQGQYSRRKADSNFSQCLAEKKVFFLKRKVMWLGVRLGAIF